MIKSKKRIRRSDEELALEALKYTRRVDFQNESNAHYKQAWRKGPEFLNKICAHMDIEWQPKWETFESVQLEAYKYNDRTSFARGSSGAYDKAQRMGWLDIVCSHMGEKCNEAYSYEEVVAEAKKYSRKSAFRKGSPGHWDAAYTRFDYEAICFYMDRSQNISSPEKSLFNIIKSIYPKTQILKDRKVKISKKPYITGFDIDIYIPELRKGIEFDGEYWHSENGLKRSRGHWPQEDIDNYHELKDSWFASRGIKILHIKEESWDKDKEACIKECLDFLGGEHEKQIA